MAKKTYTPEQIIAKLRQIEVAVANGKPHPAPAACSPAPIHHEQPDLMQ